MGLFDWLFGKKESTATVVAPAQRPPAAAQGEPARPSAAENLRRWRESGQARAWVEAHKGQWGHADWLALLEQLKGSPYWPLEVGEVGKVLEDLKREWLQRN